MSTRIQLTAEELTDFVEDQLAWLATASEGVSDYYDMLAFYRADPWVRFCGEQLALDADGIETSDHVATAAEQSKWTILLPHLGERLCYATIRQPDNKEHNSWCGSDPKLKDEDYCFEDARGYQFTSLKNVEYCLRSVDMLPAQLSAKVSRGTLVRGMSIIRIQECSAFHDGRSVFGTVYAGLNGNGDLIDPMSGLRRSFIFEQKFGVTDPMTSELGFAVAHQFARRPDWIVELALAKRRTGIGLRTDAIGARELINVLRGTNTRKGRRKSLLHWVKDHYRQRRGGNEDNASFVRAHLRGKSACDAGGFWIRIWPSRNDIERACNGKRFEQQEQPVL